MSVFLDKVKNKSQAVEQDDYDLVYYINETTAVRYAWRPYFMAWYEDGTHTKKQFHVSAITQTLVTSACNYSEIVRVRIPRTCSEIGNAAFSGCTKLSTINLTERITNIGSQAFLNCSSLTEITIPSSITAIGTSALYGCTNLANLTYLTPNVTLGTDITGFLTNLSAITLNENVILGERVFNPNSSTLKKVYGEIGNVPYCAFYGCSNITQIILGNNVTSIGTAAFLGCTSLTSINIPNTVTQIQNEAFDNCPFYSLTIPESVISCNAASILYKLPNLQDITFRASGITFSTSNISHNIKKATIGGKTVLPSGANFFTVENIILEDGITSIPNSFANGGILKTIQLPSTLQTIEYAAFQDCHYLQTIEFPDGLSSIGNVAFQFCYALKGDIIIPDTVTSIGDYAFMGDALIDTVHIPSAITSIGDCAFSGCENLKEINIPNSLSSFTQVITDCTSLTEITLPDSIVNMSYGTLYGCSGLTNVILSENLTNIKTDTFGKCYSLTNLTLPLSINYIDKYAFRLSILTKLNYKGTQDNWNSITKDDKWRDSSNITQIICTDGTINL